MPEPTIPEDGHVVRCYNAGRREPPRAPAAPAGGPEQRAERRHELLRVQGLTAWFTSERGLFSRVTQAVAETRHPVVHDVSLAIEDNECLGVVGESGSGKTTLARCIVGLHAQRSGALLLGDDELPHSARDRDRRQQRDIQIVFQNPTASLNPRMTVLQNLDYVVKRLAGITEPRARRREGRRAARARPRAAHDAGALPARAERRREAARRDRPRARGPAAAAAVRRDHLGARRLGPGGDRRADRASCARSSTTWP